MSSNPFASSMHHSLAASAGLHGVMENLILANRTWLSCTRKGVAARMDEIVIG